MTFPVGSVDHLASRTVDTCLIITGLLIVGVSRADRALGRRTGAVCVAATGIIIGIPVNTDRLLTG